MTSKTINRNARSGNWKPVGLGQPVIAAATTLILGAIFATALVVLTMVNDSATTGFLLRLTCWILVGAGVAGTFLAGANYRSGWLILLGLQPIWIAFALLTDQYGFVPGSIAYAAAQLNGYLRAGNGE
jgi:hypothetical protein